MQKVGKPRRQKSRQDYRKRRRSQYKYQEINSYLKKFEKISTSEYGNTEDVKYFQNFLQDFFWKTLLV